MSCTTVSTSSTYFHSCRILKKRYDLSLKHTNFKVNLINDDFFSFKFFQLFNNEIKLSSSAKLLDRSPILTASCDSCMTGSEILLEMPELVADKLQRLAFEFKSLPEPIDRVKRLLHYAAILDPLDESARVPENRVTGCTTQVWLDAKMDELGRMRFKADSDSEITKGFCSCLIWLLDGADAEEVLRIRPEDLEAMNVGLYGKAQSRVNTWHNVLISMQKRTKALLAEQERQCPR